ncbi:MAG: arginine--tRNA ligase [Desulfurococcales archaeon]|nr:arginine--tRNA ligase [Desulfurococcales archaeon]
MTSYIYEPFEFLKEKILRELSVYSNIDRDKIYVEDPSKPDFGDLAINLHRTSRLSGYDVDSLNDIFIKNLSRIVFVSDFKRIGGYIDLWFSNSHLASILFTSVRELGGSYGVVPVDKPMRYVVEYVSANPIHPLHIGSGRNAALGIVISSMLKMAGHHVETRFYINDMGRQIAIAVLGFRLLGEPSPPPGVKPDEWIGFIYASTHTIIDIRRLKEELDKAKIDPTRYREILSELDELVADAARLREKFPQYFDLLIDKLSGISDVEAEISRLSQAYERKTDPDVVRSFRRLVDLCLQGFRETLDRLGARFDKWDYESDIAWSGLVDEIIELARRSSYYGTHKNAPAIIFKDLQKNPEIRERLRLPKSLEIPPLIIMRSDETTLYALRDVAYSIYKFRDSKADYVINIIAAEQTLPQAQIRLALYSLGFVREAERLIHYSYEMVLLPGYKMSGRRGRFISLDQVLNEAVSRAREILKERGSRSSEDVAEKIGVAAVIFSLASISPSKQLVFRLEDALDFEKNSAPYLLYSRARAHSILEKISEEPALEEIDYENGMKDPLRRQLIIEMAKTPSIFRKAVEELSPETLASQLLKIADLFNTWYQKDPVIHEKDPGLRNFKIYMVKTVHQILTNGLKMMGIQPLDKI